MLINLVKNMIPEIGSVKLDQLFQTYAQILEELRNRNIIRTSNNPVGDYAEWLVINKFGLTMAPNSTSGYDATDSSGLKFQIKGRRLTSHDHSRQLGAIRNLENQNFDYLIAVFFNEEFEIQQVLKLPHEVIHKYAGYSEHVHAHILVIGGNVLDDVLVQDITSQFR
jgi:hypothetical protein